MLRTRHPNSDSRSDKRRRHHGIGTRSAAIALALLAGVLTLPATALAGSWGPRSSYYSGIKRVTGNGSLTRQAGGSYGSITACDQYNEGWPVYGGIDWRKFTATGSIDSSVTSRSTGQTAGCRTASWTIGWQNQYGFWVIAQACAQIGWPVPNSCTTPYNEAHRP